MATATAETKSPFTFSPLRVSTMVITAHFGTSLNLAQLLEDVRHVLIPIWYPGEGILKFEHGKEVIGESHRDVLTNRRITAKAFFNQSTLVIRRRLVEPSLGSTTATTVAPAKWKEVNIKLFANGGIQMTGISSDKFARNTLEWFITECKRLPRSPFHSTPSIEKFSIQLVNSDFSVGAPLWRDRIHNVFIKDYKLYSLFESTIYQGVNTKYYYNKKGDTKRPGQCCCKKACRGQGNGDGDGECKRITLAIFQTGNIIITGARDMEQIEEAHRFLIDVLNKNATYFVRKAPTPVAAIASK